MKTKLGILTAIIVSICMLVRPNASAIRLNIDIGDQPFYLYGPSYWDSGYEWVWVRGHWDGEHHWVHGEYRRHGEFHKEHAGEHRHHP